MVMEVEDDDGEMKKMKRRERIEERESKIEDAMEL